MNGGVNAFGSGNRAYATIGRAIRLILLNVGGGTPGDFDKSTLGHPGKYTYCIAENEAESPFAPYHVEKGFAAEDLTVFVIAAEPPHSCTNHVADDPEGILDTICSAMSTIANNNAVSSGHCTVVIGPEHARSIAAKGWTRHDIRNYLHLNSGNLFGALAFNHRYGKVYNRNLPRWYKRELELAHPDRAEPGSHPPVRDRRHGGPVFRLHPRLGAHVVASAAGHRGQRAFWSGLRRWNLLSVKESNTMDYETVFDPRGRIDVEQMPLAPRVVTLQGLRLGILDNTKWNANRLLRKTAALLKDGHGLAATNYYKKEASRNMPIPR